MWNYLLDAISCVHYYTVFTVIRYVDLSVQCIQLYGVICSLSFVMWFCHYFQGIYLLTVVICKEVSVSCILLFVNMFSINLQAA